MTTDFTNWSKSRICFQGARRFAYILLTAKRHFSRLGSLDREIKRYVVAVSLAASGVLTGSVRALLIGCAILSGALVDTTSIPVASAQIANYETLAPGILEQRTFSAQALPGVQAEVRNFLVGPGQSAENIPVEAVEITQLTAGEAEVTVGSQTSRRGPGDYWIVEPGQKYSLKSLGSMLALHVFILSKK